MSVIKIAAGVALGVAVTWCSVGAYHYARKEIALHQCVGAVDHANVRVYEVVGCMGLKGWRAVSTAGGIDWSDAP